MRNFYKAEFENSISKEWIITNGIGGYASSSIIGTNTRRYHGVLIASQNPPTERKTMVSKVEEKIIINNREYPICTNEYPVTIFPEGYLYITGFSRIPLPETTFQVRNISLKKTVFMVHGSNTTIIEYKNISETGFRLWLNPLYAGRDYHGLLNERDSFDYTTTSNGSYHSICSYAGADPVFFGHTLGTFVEGRTWNNQIKYSVDQERGHDCLEDVFSTGYMSCRLAAGASVYLVFSMDEKMMNESPAQLKEEELKRLEQLVPPETADPFLADLLRSGDQFIVKRKSTQGYTIIAGYHWFTDWGRDSMIALRGLCIATGKQDVAASVIRTFLEHLQGGVIPNRFPDYKDDLPEYITIDATLWLFVAVYEYDLKFKDEKFLESIFDKLTEILENHSLGTKNNIHLMENGLLAGGKNGIPLTWMDARIDEYSFTARAGCPVEINALWYNALMIYQYVSKRIGKTEDEQVTEWIAKIKQN
ncbi:MAG: glycogen debranching enzyme N-terminal domain-containing protein, partial [Bacteroidota bacterium]|nr:glycogen debranching enzyme N-terminal domain-containing protein [Bacteroidota bacterium]